MSDENERVTLPLIPKAQEAINRLVELTELNRTDVINRAVQFYELAETWTRPTGSYLAVVDRDGHIEKVTWT